MRMPRSARRLSDTEWHIINGVFQNSLPAWDRILLTDALGYDDAPFTVWSYLFYWIHVGPKIYPDASLTTAWDSTSNYDDVLVHEMTHVWQYYHGYTVVTSSVWARTGGAGYDYTVGQDWDDYNSEQQAQLVEEWHHKGESTTDPRFPYIDKIIRPGRGAIKSAKDVAIDILTSGLRPSPLFPTPLIKDLIDML
jgi:hypothetical protein